jgi:hypothetical protein
MTLFQSRQEIQSTTVMDDGPSPNEGKMEQSDEKASPDLPPRVNADDCPPVWDMNSNPATNCASGRGCLMTQTWAVYARALLADLEDDSNPKDAAPGEDQDPLDEAVKEHAAIAITSVLLYRSHVASFQNFEFGAVSITRQESPFDRMKAEVYYRSQSLGHPQFDILKALWEPESKQEVPFNPKVYDLLNKTAATGKKGLLKKQLDKVQLVPPSVTEFKRQKKGNKPVSEIDQPIHGHAGLRMTNAEAVLIAVRTALGSKDGRVRILELLRKYATPGGGSLLAGSASYGPARLIDLQYRIDTTLDLLNKWDDAEGQSDDRMLGKSYVTRKIEGTKARADRIIQLLNDGENLKLFSLQRLADSPLLTLELAGCPAKIVEGLRILLAAQVTYRLMMGGYPMGLNLRQSFGFMDTTLASTGTSIRISVGTEPDEYFEALVTAIRALDTDLASVHSKCTQTTPEATTPEARWKHLGLGQSAESRGDLFPFWSLGRAGSINVPLATYMGIVHLVENGGKLSPVDFANIVGKQLSEVDKEDREPDLLRDYEERVWTRLKSSATVTTPGGNDKGSVATAQVKPSELAIVDVFRNILFVASDVITLSLTRSVSGHKGLFPHIASAVVDVMQCTMRSAISLLQDEKLFGNRMESLVRLHLSIELRNAAEEMGESCLLLQSVAGWQQNEVAARRRELRQVARNFRNEIESTFQTYGPDSSEVKAVKNSARSFLSFARAISRPLAYSETWFRNDVKRRLRAVGVQADDIPVGVFRTDSGEQTFAIVIAMLQQALPAPEKKKKKPRLNVWYPKSTLQKFVYFEIPSFLNEFVVASELDSWDVLTWDFNPYLAKVEGTFEDQSSSFENLRDIIQKRCQTVVQGKGTQFTVIIDTTNCDYTELMPLLISQHNT